MSSRLSVPGRLGGLTGAALTGPLFPLVCSYLVMPFMGTDLGKLMKMERLTEDRVQFLVYQMLRGLKVTGHKCFLNYQRKTRLIKFAINSSWRIKWVNFFCTFSCSKSEISSKIFDKHIKAKISLHNEVNVNS